MADSLITEVLRLGNPADLYPTSLYYCGRCNGQTKHRLLPGGVVCVQCELRILSRELDRD